MEKEISCSFSKKKNIFFIIIIIKVIDIRKRELKKFIY